MSGQARWTSGLPRSDLPSSAEQICQAFETAWGAGERPALEAYLRDTPAADRAALLGELLARFPDGASPPGMLAGMQFAGGRSLQTG